MPTVIWVATERHLQHNFNTEGGYQFSPAWKIIQMVKQQKGHHKHMLPMDPMPVGGTVTTPP
jgi:hypothetical protein